MPTHPNEEDQVGRTIESSTLHHADFVSFDRAMVLGKKAGA